MWELLLGEGAKRRGAAGGPQTLRVPGRAEMGAGGGKGREEEGKQRSREARPGEEERPGPATQAQRGGREGDPLPDAFPAAPGSAGGEGRRPRAKGGKRRGGRPGTAGPRPRSFSRKDIKLRCQQSLCKCRM